MKTNYKYIHEFDIIDEFYEDSNAILESLQNDIHDYYKAKSEAELKSFFEHSNIDIIMEKDKEGIVTRLGNAIISLVKKITDSIAKFVNKIFHRSEKIESDVDIVNKMIIEHPEIRDAVVKGIKEEWFTYRDVAAYEKDVVQLMIMLEKEQISHKKFKEKVGEKTDKFISGGKKIALIGGTVAALLLIVPKTLSAYKQCKKAGNEIANTMKKSKGKAKNIKESASGDDSYIQTQEALLSGGANAYNIINKYNNVQLSNLEKIMNAIKSTSEDLVGKKEKA